MRLTTDAKSGLVLLILCVAMFIAAFQIKEHSYASLGAEVFPLIVLSLLTPLCLALFIKGLRQGVSQDIEPMTLKRIGQSIVKFRTVYFSFLIFLGLVALIPVLGFPLSGALYMAAMLWVLGPRSLKQVVFVIVMSVGVTGTIYVVFRFLLYVILPEGIFFGE